MLAGTVARLPHRNSPATTLDYEIAQERAVAFCRLARGLEQALQALADFDTAKPCPTGATILAARRTLAAQAADALGQFVVQYEACGMRDSRYIMRHYRVPPEVRDRMGVRPPPSAVIK